MRFSLRFKFVVALLFCLASVILPGMYRLNQIKAANFEKEVHNRTALVSEFGKATQAYVAEQLKPATEAETDGLVLEAMSSFYATRSIFEHFNKVLPEYMYREPTLDPLNPLDQADEFESTIIRRFQLDQSLSELAGYRQSENAEEKFYIAKPTQVKASCLKCHGQPDDAPPEIVENYGREHGYNWKIGDIVSASMIYVPTADLRAGQAIVHRTIVGTFGILGLAAAGSLLALFEGLINRRVTRIGKALQQRTLCPNAPIRLNDQAHDEVGMLSRQFNQMADALDVAYEDLENKVADRTSELTETLASLKSTQSRLIQAEKMSSLGRMVGGIAHEINNPANFIHGNLTYTREYVESLIELTENLCDEIPEAQRSEDLQAQIEEIDLPFLAADFTKLHNSMQTGTERIRDIVASLRNFARLDESGLKKVDLHEGIESTLLTLQNRLEATSQHDEIEICKDYSQLPPVECLPAQINQVILHLLNNAIDAVKNQPNPRIHIKTDQIEAGCRICIVDNGAGISADILPFIFDPFFTTKPIGQGTGLGLAVSHQIIVETHRGELLCESSPGQGTTLTAIIPITAKENP